MSLCPDNPDAKIPRVYDFGDLRLSDDEFIAGMMDDGCIKFEVYLMAHDVMDSHDS